MAVLSALLLVSRGIDSQDIGKGLLVIFSGKLSNCNEQKLPDLDCCIFYKHFAYWLCYAIVQD